MTSHEDLAAMTAERDRYQSELKAIKEAVKEMVKYTILPDDDEDATTIACFVRGEDLAYLKELADK
jgi:hypothetical protein